MTIHTRNARIIVIDYAYINALLTSAKYKMHKKCNYKLGTKNTREYTHLYIILYNKNTVEYTHTYILYYITRTQWNTHTPIYYITRTQWNTHTPIYYII